jgi:signal transduction histidine kinase
VPPSIGNELLAVLRESLSNVSRHANARSVSVHIAVDSATLTVVITDDGIGLPEGAREIGQGLRNMRARAADLGGTFALESPPGGGVRVHWSVPLAAGQP